MDWSGLQGWLDSARIWIVALSLLGATFAAALFGMILRSRRERRRQGPSVGEGQEGYIVSAVLGLLALLTGFTFSLAVDRFETRRYLVVDEANAIGTTYLRAQLLEEPHRTRMSNLLVRYTDNRLSLANAQPDHVAPLLATNDALVVDIWTATRASFDSIKGLDFSSAYLDSVNAMIDLDASRKAARQARVPTEVFVLLIIYLVVSAGVLGYVLIGLGGRMAAGFLMVLMTLSLALILDIDRPTLGGIVEGQGAMEALQSSLHRWSPATFDDVTVEPGSGRDAP